MTVVVPAIIAKTQQELDRILKKLEGKASRVMLDIMDGRFVKNHSLNFDFKLSFDFDYEAHLMVENPIQRIEEVESKVNRIILHVEVLEDIKKAVEFVKSRGLEVILALNPESKADLLKPFLNIIDGVLIMTVHPGRYGARFLPDTLVKCKKIRELDKAIPIEVDGGMNPYNAKLARDAGANVIASGSFIVKSNDVQRALNQLSG
jgi:ribulose-phosphate 3-epimerase